MKNFIRLPHTTDRSLKAWSAVDEHILRYLGEVGQAQKGISIYHDRFGYLTCNLIKYHPTTITYLDSQRQAIEVNAKSNGINSTDLNLVSLLEDIPSNGNLTLMKIPKSLDLFRMYLIQLTDTISSDGIAIDGFMTRHFSKAMLAIANEFFESVEQSKAWKKSRLFILSKPKEIPTDRLNSIRTIKYKDYDFKQYFGVFSASHIDYATQFLLENLTLRDSEKSFVDIGCGNGVIGKYLLDQRTWDEAVLMDDSILATASTSINLKNYTNTAVVNSHNFESFRYDQFDLVITNPPFHFEYEVDPSISIQMMQDTQRILAPNGRLVIVANRHLNYKSQLSKWYQKIDVIAENDKFLIYEAFKSSSKVISNFN